MRGMILVAACLSASGCLAYENPTLPGYVPPSTTAPASLTIGAFPTSAGNQSTVSARVQNVNGAPLAGVPVDFTTDTGTLSADMVVTAASGVATTMWTGTGPANLDATTGTLHAHTIVVSVPATGPQTPAPQLAFLNVPQSAVVGVPVTFNVSSSATGMTWFWSFGDGSTDSGTAFSITHRYTQTGVYTANVSSSGTLAASATITVTKAP